MRIARLFSVTGVFTVAAVGFLAVPAAAHAAPPASDTAPSTVVEGTGSPLDQLFSVIPGMPQLPGLGAAQQDKPEGAQAPKSRKSESEPADQQTPKSNKTPDEPGAQNSATYDSRPRYREPIPDDDDE
ncbi:hypothetical protein AB0H76_09830 [Nocardia sp. NPDC050712]|uniref:hypothetical protein n=1 Tax=Nocardia sp. NPDC050712 TaxID=3155518 RepID=UPI0033C7EE6D